MMWFVLAWAISFFFASLFYCGRDIEAVWGTATDLAEKCANINSLQLGLTASDALSDLIILLMPLPMVCSDEQHQRLHRLLG